MCNLLSTNNKQIKGKANIFPLKIKKRFVGFVKVLHVIMSLTRESEGPFIFSTDTYINEI